MGKVTYLMNVSLDGYVDSPEDGVDWGTVDEELHSFFNEQARKDAAVLYGRRLWEVMGSYWPTAESDPDATPAMLEFARIWNATPKIVFSSTLESVEGARVVRGDVRTVLDGLRREFDGDLSIGGPTLAASFIEHGLVDEYGLVVHPVMLGAGTPFFPRLGRRINLRRVETRSFESGLLYVRYAAA